MMPFVEAVNKLLIAKKVTMTDADPLSLINEYEPFASTLYNRGYDDYLVEYDNDLSVRDVIEILLCENSLQQYDEMKSFIERVQSADKLLRSSFFEGKERRDEREWWNRGIVRKGSGVRLSRSGFAQSDRHTHLLSESVEYGKFLLKMFGVS